jgi:hypothetical protein
MTITSLYLIIAFTLGFFVGIKFILFSIEQRDKKEKSKIEDIFIKILDNTSKLKFGQRVHTYVQIKTENYLLVYMMDKQELALFNGEEYIANSTQINPDISEKIIDFIKNKLKSYSHTEFNNSEHIDNVNIDKHINENKNHINQNSGSWKKVKFDDYFPKAILNNIEKYKAHILEADDCETVFNYYGQRILDKEI